MSVPLEDALNGVEGLDRDPLQIGGTAVLDRADFRPGADLLKARQLVSERIATVTPSLPTWAAPPMMLQPLSSTSRVMKIGLTSDDALADRNVHDLLLEDPAAPAACPGRGQHRHLGRTAANASGAGRPGEDEGPRRHAWNQVMDVTANALDAGLLQYSPGLRHRHRRPHRDAEPAAQHPARAAHHHSEDLAQITIEERNGKPLRLGDVANVVEDHQPLIGDAVINQGPRADAHR